MKAILIFGFFVLFISFVNGQVNPDTTTIIDGFSETNWSKIRIAPRLSFGTQKHFYSEIGISLHNYWFNGLGYASNALYLSLEWNPIIKSQKNQLLGYKIGYEINSRFIALGLDTKIYNFNDKNFYYITPRIGLGFFGLINLFYGYNVLIGKSRIENISYHQFSLVLNYNSYLIKALLK